MAYTLESKLKNNIKYITDEQWDYIRVQLVNHKLPVDVWNMNITVLHRDFYLMVQEIKWNRAKGRYRKIHTFLMMETDNGNLYNLVKIS
jgi:hypothetical protein